MKPLIPPALVEGCLQSLGPHVVPSPAQAHPPFKWYWYWYGSSPGLGLGCRRMTEGDERSDEGDELGRYVEALTLRCGVWTTTEPVSDCVASECALAA
jgi:hypothetical protein